MSESHYHHTGVIRTASGRETYAPDGHVEYQEEIERPDGSRSSSDSSDDTRYAPLKTSRTKSSQDAPEGSSSSDEVYPVLTRRKTEAAIEDADRRELQQLYSTLSRQQSVIASPGDAKVDPQSDQFNLSSFLRMFRQQLEAEGHTVRQVGLVYKNLNVYGSGAALQLQKTVTDLAMSLFRVGEMFSFGKKDHKHILRNFDGVVKPGELLIVLGRPGSGCSTLLKTMCGELHGLEMGEDTIIHYNGIPQKQMMKEFKGEAIYNQEVDKHFPHLTVGQTLEFAAATRTPSHRIQNMSRKEFYTFVARVVMAVVGLSHTYNTKVGDDYVRGVSGGERKRVSIAEMMLAGSPFAAWDNSTRGLDSGELSSTPSVDVTDIYSNRIQVCAVIASRLRLWRHCGGRCHLPSQSKHLRHFRQGHSAIRGPADLLWPCRRRQVLFRATGLVLPAATDDGRLSHEHHQPPGTPSARRHGEQGAPHAGRL
jgi:ATP-binding cassette subfamily G (WHITE) protein 2 (PDR)